MINIDQYIAKKFIIVIAGATASGKTGLGIELGELLPAEIISADSRQIYKYLDIGTAKATADEQAKIKHHLIDFLEPNEQYSAGKFSKDALEITEQIFANGKIPIVVGGSGLYIKALCEGLFDDGLDNDFSEIRIQLEKRLNSDGIEPLYSELSRIDPPKALLYSDKNPRRIIRALEYFYSNGVSLSEAQNKFAENRTLCPVYFGIKRERSELYDRINRRTEIMWHDGLLEETEKILEMGFSKDENSLNTVGYKETISFINGDISEAECINLIAQHTRNYAKRQMTWFNKVEGMNWIEPKASEIMKYLEA